MPEWLLWALAGVVLLGVLDRVLLWLEARGWINYRRRGLGRGGATYHALELQSMFNPGAREVMEAKYGEEEEEDESGAPPGERGTDGPP
jgi:hypothetical protein